MGIFFRAPSPQSKKLPISDSNDISEIIQGEIARLDQRFKVELDPLQHQGSKTIHLICRLGKLIELTFEQVFNNNFYFLKDDRDLPYVPPLSVKVPQSYPSKPPQCQTDDDEYNASPILAEIRRSFDCNLSKLPCTYSISTLLNRWVSLFV